MLLVVFSIISWSSMSSTLATSDVEGISYLVLLRIMDCWGVILPLGTSLSLLLPSMLVSLPNAFNFPSSLVSGSSLSFGVKLLAFASKVIVMGGIRGLVLMLR